ncbi:MAG: phosphate transporter substrate-binding protein, partial [Actinomycetia bacterium]|nr:phosphate transporter substrate-binding protein [Actinomycetes bacterium]
MLSFRKKSLAAVGLAMGMLVTYAPQAAHAVPSTVLALAGSDTTWGVMQGGSTTHTGLSTLFNNSQSAIQAVDVPPKLGAPYPGAPFAVPGDSTCGAFNYDLSDADHTPPNGSGAGITRLNQNTGLGGGTGCVDVARSSRSRGTEPSNDEFYVYALDSVTVAAFPALNSGVPTTLSVQDVKDLYSCDGTGQAPKVSTWNQLSDATNSDTNAVHRYLPQTGSGTRNFFLTTYMGIPSANTNTF